MTDIDLGASPQLVIDIWSRPLGIEKIESSDNFFVLGGDFLLGTAAVGLLSEALPIEVTTEDLYDYPTFDTLTEYIRTQLAS